MHITDDTHGRTKAIADLVAASFTASEGPREGTLIGDLVRGLLADTPAGDIRVFVADEDGAPIGVGIFTRLTFAEDPRRVFLLSPMAVAPNQQGRGVGQALLRHALSALRGEGVDIAMTYGDPAFYGKVGFMPVSVTVVPPPLPLSQPQGWVGQSLTGAELTPLQGPSACATALNDPTLW